MSTPTKRRKKNDYQASPKATKSLEFFFNKQKKAREEDLQADDVDECEDIKSTGRDTGDHDLNITAPNGAVAVARTDEELARSLQDEWNREVQERRDGGDGTLGPEDQIIKDGILSGEESFKGNSAGSDEATVSTEKTKNTLSLQSITSAEDTITSNVPFDENPLTFDPSKYLPELRKQWDAIGGEASYDLLTRAFVLVNSTQSRIKIVDTLVNFLRVLVEGDPNSLLPAVRFPSFKTRLKSSEILESGVADYQRDLAAIRLSGTRPGGLLHLQSAQKSAWA